MKLPEILKTVLVIFFTSGALSAQEIREEESLNFTYTGPVISSAYNNVKYTDWFATETKTKKMTGFSLSTGAALNIFADNLCGDFQIKYAYNQFDFSITDLEFSVSGKYYYPINNFYSAGSGLGLYFEGPPSNQEHNGSAGLQIPVSLLLNTTPNTKLFIDLFFRYGSFGIGKNTEAISAGVNVGFIYKVGRI